MKKLSITLYDTKLSKLRGLNQDATDRKIDTRDLIEVVLDQVPQGGFSPKDIRDRNRIQKVIDESHKADNEEESDYTLSFEDEDFKNLTKLVNESRWGSRSTDLVDFLLNFEKE